MRIVELSNHPGEMLQENRRRRLAAEDQDQSRYEKVAARHLVRVQQARDAVDQARGQRRWWAWLRAVLALRRTQRQAPAPVRSARWDDRQEEEVLKAGITGEQIAVTGFSRVLGDEWTLFRGYRNGGGEIDHLLLGPRGLIAIEGKHRNATVHCDRDDWWFEKYDRYGHVVDRGSIADRRGRSPSVQLNEPADQLEEFLRSRGCPVAVQRVLLFTHPRSELGSCRHPTVRLATSTDQVVAILGRMQPVLDGGQLDQLRHLIERDHKFHQARRAARGTRRDPGAATPVRRARRARRVR